MKRRFNPWPWGVVFAFALFIGGTVGLVLIACSQRSDLVRADYYDQEIRHQEQMDRVERTRREAPEASVSYDADHRWLLIALPVEHAQRRPTGRIHLYRPSAANLDRDIPLALDVTGRQVLPATDLQPGLWRVEISWAVDEVEYFHDERVVVAR